MDGCPDCGGEWPVNQGLYRVADGVWKCIKHVRLNHPEGLAKWARSADTYEITHHFFVHADSPQAAVVKARELLRQHGFTHPTIFVKARPE